MTDEEMKRLEDLAKERDLYSFAFEATPEAILALFERVRKAEEQGEKWRTMLRDAQRYGNLLDQMLPTVITRDATTDSLIKGYGDAIEGLQNGLASAERKGAEKAAALVASLPERLGHKQVPYRAAIIDAETWIRTMLVDAP